MNGDVDVVRTAISPQSAVWRGVVALALCAIGCGGGGGSSSGGRAADFGVRVVHTAVDAAPMTMAIDGKPIPDYRVNFGEVGPLVELSTGAHTIVVAEVGGGISRSVSVSVEREERVSILMTDEGVVAIPLREERVASPREGCPLSFLHGVDGVAALTFRVGGKQPVSVQPASLSSPVVVSRGVQVVSVEGEGVLDRAVVTCEDDKPLVVAASGLAGYFVHLAAGK